MRWLGSACPQLIRIYPKPQSVQRSIWDYIHFGQCLFGSKQSNQQHTCVLRCSFCSRMHTLCTDKHTYILWLTVTGVSSFFECTKMICMCLMQPIYNFQLPFLGLDWLWAKYNSKVLSFQPASSTDSNCIQYVPVSSVWVGARCNRKV